MKQTTMARSLITAGILTAVMVSTPLALGQTKSANPPDQKAASAAAASNTRNDPKPIEDLQMAAQRLRDAIHQMLNEPKGPKQAELIKNGDQALAEVERAMVNLPPDLLIAHAKESTYKKSEDRLQQATNNLHAATQALAKDPNSPRRNETVKKIKTALLEVHHLMYEIPRGASGK